MLINLILLNFKECDKLINELRKKYNNEDVNDANDLINNFKNKNSKNFSNSLSYCYHLFERNLIKSVNLKFEEFCKSQESPDDFLGGEIQKEINSDDVARNDEKAKNEDDEYL